MGSRRLRPMTAADLQLLPEPCARCGFWEASLSDLAATTDHVDGRVVKAEWAEAVTRYWGYCGVMAFADDQPIGHPVGPDAAVVMSAHVAAELRGKGLGKQLMHFAAGLVARRDLRALEAVGTYHDGPSCMLPIGFLEAVGFQVVRPHPITPRLRMDLQNTVRWRPGLSAAWNRLTGLVLQPETPEPATYTHREGAS